MSCSSGGQHLSTATEARDFSHYLRALFPYATQQQLNELGHEDRTQEEAERHGYAALNPDVMSASFATYQLNEHRAKVRRDVDVFSGVAAHLLHRNAALQRRAKLRRLSGWEDFNANVGAFVVDTSRWDEVVLQPCAATSTCVHQALPLRTESVVGGLASSPSPLPLGRWILCVEASLRASARLFVAHDVFPAPIMRWAPRVSGILFAERTILSAHDTSTSSMEDLSMPPHLLEASSGSSPTPIRLNRLHNDDDDDDDGSFITADLLRPQVEPISAVEVGWGCPSMPTTSFSTYSPNQHIIAPDYLAALAERKSYWSRVLMKMQSFVHAIRRANDVSASTKHDVVAFINRYCPTMVDRAPLLLERLLPVCARALTGSVVLPYVDEQRISFFGHKRLSCGPITIGALTFDVPRCTYAPTDDKEKLAVRLVASCVELMEIDFAYLSEAKAEKWEAVLRETGDEEMAQSGYSCDATRGKLYVGAKDVVICGELVLKLWATGSLQLCLQKAKVTVGSMSISTNVCHLRPLLWLTSCIIKSSLETSAQQALREISLEMS